MVEKYCSKCHAQIDPFRATAHICNPAVDHWIQNAALKIVCGDVPGICENPEHHMRAIEVEKVLREAYDRGSKTSKNNGN